MTKLEEIAQDIRRMVVKSASAPGQGETTFPQDEVDDGQSEASEGARGRENSADVKDVVEHASIETTTAPSSESQESVQPQIGLTQSETGGDPSVEDDYESRQKDPGTDAPAKVGEGEKYAAWSLEKLAAEADRLTAQLAGSAAAPAATPRAAAPAATPKEAAAAGYADAAAAGAADRRFMEATVKEAIHAAALTAQYLPYYHQKAAEGDLPLEGLPPDEGAPPEEAPPLDEAGPPPAGGDPGASLEDALGGEAPPSDAPATADEAIDGFNGAADDMQITPEMLEAIVALLQQQQGAPAVAKAAKFQKLAAAAVGRRMAGGHTIGPPKTARAAAIREGGRKYLVEIVSLAQSRA